MVSVEFGRCYELPGPPRGLRAGPMPRLPLCFRPSASRRCTFPGPRNGLGTPFQEVSLQSQILPLRGAIQHYDWGSRTALAELSGRPTPSPRPEAELWLGAHPRGPAEVLFQGRWERLDALVESDGEALLGRATWSARGPQLPFLLKVLAVARPLSLQAHPDAERARAGFAEAPVDGVQVYADPHAKPELVCALSRFRALCGFLPLAELRAHAGAVGLDGLVAAGDDDAAVLRRLLGDWLGPASVLRGDGLARVLEGAARRAARDPACARVRALAELHPGDPGVLAPLFLREVELAPGEAMFLAPGVLHGYLDGVAVELMAPSDNVLRGGLTTKPVHVAELMRVLRFESATPAVLHAEPRAPGEAVWRAPTAAFELSELRPAAHAPVAIAARASVEVLWCAEGALEVAAGGGPGLALRRGESCLVPAAAGPYRVGGAGRAFRAGLPLGAAAAPGS